MGLTEGPGRGRQRGVLARASRDLGPPGSPRQAGVGQSPETGNGAGAPSRDPVGVDGGQVLPGVRRRLQCGRGLWGEGRGGGRECSELRLIVKAEFTDQGLEGRRRQKDASASERQR